MPQGLFMLSTDFNAKNVVLGQNVTTTGKNNIYFNKPWPNVGMLVVPQTEFDSYTVNVQPMPKNDVFVYGQYRNNETVFSNNSNSVLDQPPSTQESKEIDESLQKLKQKYPDVKELQKQTYWTVINMKDGKINEILNEARKTYGDTAYTEIQSYLVSTRDIKNRDSTVAQSSGSSNQGNDQVQKTAVTG